MRDMALLVGFTTISPKVLVNSLSRVRISPVVMTAKESD